jgi:hypothetical protein
MRKTKTMTCGDCGKRFRSLKRTHTFQDDDTLDWRSYYVCRRCWAGVLLVDDSDPDCLLRCDECGRSVCPVSKALQEQWEEQVEEYLEKRYPNARVEFMPASEFQTEMCTWQSDGYEVPDITACEYNFDTPVCPYAEDEDEDEDEDE